MIRSPRQTFFAGPHKAAFEQFVTSESFQAAGQFAMLELLFMMPDTSNPNTSWDCHAQLVGARRFWALLSSMHEKSELPQREKEPSLHYKDKG